MTAPDNDTPLRSLAVAEAATAVTEHGRTLRTRGTLSAPARRALRETDAAQLDAICAHLARSADTPSAAEDRERLEAARSAVLRVALLLDLAPGAMPSLRSLDAAFTRRALAATDEDDGTTAAPLRPDGPRGDLDEVAGEAPSFAPPGEALDAFLRHGSHAAWVRAWAEASADLGPRLEALFDEAEATGLPLSLQAWRWRRSRGRTTLTVSLGLPLSLAADDGTATPVVRELGRLDPVAAVARLVLRGAQVELRVLPLEAGAVRAVRLGKDLCDHPDADDVWTLEVAWQAEPLPLRVEGADGSCFEESLGLTRERQP